MEIVLKLWCAQQVKQPLSAISYPCPSFRKRTSRFLLSFCIRLWVLQRRVTVIEPLHTITLLACSEGPRSWEVPFHILRRPWRLNTITCISVSRQSMSVYRSRTPATFIWTFAQFYRKWESMSLHCNTRWRRWFWSRMNWFPRCHRAVLRHPNKTFSKKPVRVICLDYLSKVANLKIVLSFFASPIITLPLNKSSSSSTRHL